MLYQEIPIPYDKSYFIVNHKNIFLGWVICIKFLFGWGLSGSPLNHVNHHSSMTLHVLMYPKCGANIPMERVCVINPSMGGGVEWWIKCVALLGSYYSNLPCLDPSYWCKVKQRLITGLLWTYCPGTTSFLSHDGT